MSLIEFHITSDFLSLPEESELDMAPNRRVDLKAKTINSLNIETSILFIALVLYTSISFSVAVHNGNYPSSRRISCVVSDEGYMSSCQVGCLPGFEADYASLQTLWYAPPLISAPPGCSCGITG